MTNTKRLLSLCTAALMLAGITGCSNSETSSTANGLTATTISNDGIAVILNNDNPVDNLTSEQIMNIYTGSINFWNEIDR